METLYLPSAGDAYGTSNQYIVYQIRVAEGEYNPSSRTRDVTISVVFWRTNNYTTTRSGTCYCTIDGTPYSQNFSNASISLASDTVLFSMTKTVSYNNYGNASLSIYAHWQTQAGSTGDAYTSESQGGTVSLTSVSPISHTVSYDANGGTGAPGSDTKVYGSILTLSNVIPIRNGYKFLRWNTKADGSGNSYAAGGQYGADQNGGTVTLYAQWEVSNVAYIKQNGSYVACNTYCKSGGQWQPAICYVKDNGVYKQSTI